MNYMLYSVNDIDKARALIFINSTYDICSFQLMFPWVTKVYIYMLIMSELNYSPLILLLYIDLGKT